MVGLILYLPELVSELKSHRSKTMVLHLSSDSRELHSVLTTVYPKTWEATPHRSVNSLQDLLTIVNPSTVESVQSISPG